MAKEEPILIDKTELILMATKGGGSEMLNVTYEKVIRIEFRKCDEKNLFKSFPSEEIRITVRGREEPVVFQRSKVGESEFERYKAGLAKFAKDNRVSFASNL